MSRINAMQQIDKYIDLKVQDYDNDKILVNLEGNVTLSIPKGLLVTHPQGHTNRTQTRSLDNAEFLMWNYTLPSQ